MHGALQRKESPAGRRQAFGRGRTGYLLVAVAGGVAAFFISARSLQLGPAVPVIAVTSIASNASAIPAGIIVFGDPIGDGAEIVLRSLAFVMVMVAAALIPAPIRAARDERADARTASPQFTEGSSGMVAINR